MQGRCTHRLPQKTQTNALLIKEIVSSTDCVVRALAWSHTRYADESVNETTYTFQSLIGNRVIDVDR